MTISILKSILSENKLISKKNFLALLSSLGEQINDEPNLAFTFGASGGLTFLKNYFEGKILEDDSSKSTKENEKDESLLLNKLLLHLVSELFLNHNFLQDFVFFPLSSSEDIYEELFVNIDGILKINFSSLTKFDYLIEGKDHPDLVRYHYSCLFNILESYEKINSSSISQSQNEVKVTLSFNEYLSKLILDFVKNSLCPSNLYFNISLDFLSSLFTTNFSYKESSLIAMSNEISSEERNESLETRKEKNRKREIASYRAYKNAHWAIDLSLLDMLIKFIDNDNPSVRRASSTSLGVLLRAIDQYSGPREDALKQYRIREKKKQLKELNQEIDEEKISEEENKTLSEIQRLILPYIPGHQFQNGKCPECKCFGPCNSSCEDGSLSFLRLKQRAALEAALLSTNLDLGAWVVNHPSGGNGRQLLRLASCPYTKGVEVACEVLCLAANNDTLTDLLINLSKEKVFENLIENSLDPSIKAAAASTILKLTVKTKASISGNSSGGLSTEVFNSLNAANEIIKSHIQLQEKKKENNNNKTNPKLVSFSNFDNTHVESEEKKKNLSLSNNATVMSPLERSIEALAILSKNFRVKQYISKEIIKNIAKLDIENSDLIDSNSSCRFGIAHIISSITVTNRELLALALREKDMTIDQYEKMKELQRVSAKDDNGNSILKDNLEDLDEDTQDNCKFRIKQCTDAGILKLLALIINSISSSKSHTISTSSLALENSVRALRQICVNENVRGVFIQSGSFHGCVDISLNNTIPSSIRREASHAVAKSLVTTNPHLLTEPIRISAIRSLIFLCKDVDSTNLQQFEALLALTNLLSCGEAEQDRLASENGTGLQAVHYLMFSDNKMVSRAATEALCNMASNESLLKILSVRDKVKIWLGFCENIFDYTENDERIMVTSISSLPDDDKYYSLANDVNSEEFKIASAASGTLAVACDADPNVALALLNEDVTRTIAILIKSKSIPLIHRALIISLNLIQGEHSKTAVFDKGFSSKEFLTLLFSLPAVSPIEEIAQEFIQTLSAIVKNK